MSEAAHGPWYVRVMLGVAGLIAALFLLGFVGFALQFVFDNKVAALVTGAIFIGAAYGLLFVARGDFSAMFAFALSLAGQVLVGIGVFGLLDSRSSGPTAGAAAWGVMAAIELGIAFLMPNYIHRLAAALAAGVMLQLALTPLGGHALAAGLLTAAAVLAWLAARQSEPAQDVFVPMGYGAVLALIQTEAGLTGARWLFLGPHGEWLSPQAGQALVLAVFIAAIAAYLIHAGWRLEERRTVVALGVALLVGAASLKAPGIASGLLILLLGFAVGRRVMIGLGIAALLFCISSYYYLLDATLLYKAGVLAATGAGLLAARWVILRLVLPPEPGNA